MASPEVTTEEQEADVEPESTDEAESEPAPEDPEVIEVELTEDDFEEGEGLFTGVEDAELDDEPGEESIGPVGEKADEALGLTDESSNVEAAINEGAARLAVVGLDPEYKLEPDEDLTESDCLEAEFHDVFSAFRLGYFGAGVLDEYVFTEDDTVDPAWGLLGAMLCATAFTIWLRPDGDELVTDLTGALGGLGGGA